MQEINEINPDEFREKLSSMSFEDLQKLKAQIGSVMYDQLASGSERPKIKTDFKRLNKNRPREMSSKCRVKHVEATATWTKKIVSRDPRFDPMCGTFDSGRFQKRYKFIDEIKQEEREQLKEELKTTQDETKKQNINFVLQRMNNQLREVERKNAVLAGTAKEKELNKERIKQGGKPAYKKKSEKRLENLVQKYEQLKKTNRLQKHIEKRSKMLAVKDRIKQETLK